MSPGGISFLDDPQAVRKDFIVLFPAQKVDIVDLVGPHLLGSSLESLQVVVRPWQGSRLQNLLQFGQKNIPTERESITVRVYVQQVGMVRLMTL